MVTKQVASREDPEGRGFLKCTGGWLQVSTQPYDMLLAPTPTPTRLDGARGRYRNLTPFLQYARAEGQGNCRWTETSLGYPVLISTRTLPLGTQLIAEGTEQANLDQEAEDGVPEEDTQGQEEDKRPGPENQREGEDDPPDKPKEATGEEPEGGGTAWNARATRAKAWVEELRLTLSGTHMWCYLQQRGNLYLCTINVNGKPVGKELQQQILRLSQLSDCPIDDFILVDTRTAVKQMPFQMSSWRKVFATTEIVIKILPAMPMVGTDPDKARHWKMVGGSTLIFLPRPGIYIRGEPTYDPAKLGIYMCVAIGVGPTKSVL
jgi:hypothetical protein